MYELVKKAANNKEYALELAKSKKDITEIVDAVSELSLKETMTLGTNFKQFPIGCDLTEVVVGTCASDLEKIDLIGNCKLANMIGAPIHICAYAFADIAESYNQKGIDIMKEVYDNVDVPLDLDHFGKYGAMRFPKSIVKCNGDCYNKGPIFTECPKKRIHQRSIDKEKLDIADKENWVKLSSSVAINLTSEQNGEGHSAPLEEAQDIANLAKKYGKGLEVIMFVGDGYDDLITGFENAIKIGADVFVIEGGPFNGTNNTTETFAKTIAMSRILCPGKVVATNGAYENECRAGLRSGLNLIITGFPNNHHGYMCGYEPGTAKRGKFGLPRVLKIMNDEVKDSKTRVPIQREELIALARAVKIAGENNIYPKKIGSFTIGDAHWATIKNSKLYDHLEITNDLSSIVDQINGNSISLHGGRFLSWLIAKEIDKEVDEIIITDIDPWVEKATISNLQSSLSSTLISGNSNDLNSSKLADSSVITSTVKSISQNISKKIPNAINLF